ncbi:uncharacterized protein LOC131685077 [Topomyia yanbarensis]|uniref:uncharacterized protein LOC131685077 n=1 Tax=Topomyia yanbarensis TaxID=2498891 RepID=UPI00273AEBD8|nr:uncharacterized protein LOC131685077 [Topomyia yanbarensis]
MKNYAHLNLLAVLGIISLPSVIGYGYSYSSLRHHFPYEDEINQDDSLSLGSESDEIHQNCVITATRSEKKHAYAVPVYQKIGVPVPHPVPVAVPQYVKVNIPQPYPVQVNVEQHIKVPVYRIVPKIIERPVPYTVEKSYPVEVEKPFPVEVLKKIEIPVPKPYPVPVPVYRHVTHKEKTHRSWRY